MPKPAVYLHTIMVRTVAVQWFDVAGTVYGLNSRLGITNTDGEAIEMVPVTVATAILIAAAKLK